MALFLLLMQLIPMILEIVKGIERTSDGKTKIGAEKSALALEAIQVCFEASGDMTKKFSWAKLLPTIANIINAFVGFANRTGLFQQQPSEPQPDGQ